MTYRVLLTGPADADLDRLAAFLGGQGEDVALRAVRLIREAIGSLTSMPDRGRPVLERLRKLIIPFGAGGYIIRYRVSDQTVLVTRIFHSFEDRPLA